MKTKARYDNGPIAFNRVVLYPSGDADSEFLARLVDFFSFGGTIQMSTFNKPGQDIEYSQPDTIAELFDKATE